MEKRDWKKPELIVLVRGKSEEAILLGCKGDPITSATSRTSNIGCYANPPCSTNLCSEITLS